MKLEFSTPQCNGKNYKIHFAHFQNYEQDLDSKGTTATCIRDLEPKNISGRTNAIKTESFGEGSETTNEMSPSVCPKSYELFIFSLKCCLLICVKIWLYRLSQLFYLYFSSINSFPLHHVCLSFYPFRLKLRVSLSF